MLYHLTMWATEIGELCQDAGVFILDIRDFYVCASALSRSSSLSIYLYVNLSQIHRSSVEDYYMESQLRLLIQSLESMIEV